LEVSDMATTPQTTSAPRRDSDDARQGVTGHHVRAVLGWGVIATILAFAVVAITA